MILFAGCGVTQDVKQINSKILAEFGNEIAEEVSTELDEDDLSEQELELFRKLSQIEGQESESDSTINGASIGDAFRKMTYVGPTAIPVMVKHGKLGLVYSIVYALAGLFFIIKPKISFKIIIGVLIVSILFAIYQLMGSYELDISYIMKKGLEFNLYFGIFGDIILLIIIAVSGKSFFSDHGFAIDYYDNP